MPTNECGRVPSSCSHTGAINFCSSIDYPGQQHGPGSFGHKEKDVQQFADWGVDHAVDNCGNPDGGNQSIFEYAAFHDALVIVNKSMVCGIWAVGLREPWAWAKLSQITGAQLTISATAGARTPMLRPVVPAPRTHFVGPKDSQGLTSPQRSVRTGGNIKCSSSDTTNTQLIRRGSTRGNPRAVATHISLELHSLRVMPRRCRCSRA